MRSPTARSRRALRRRRLDRIGDRDDARRPAVDREEHHRLRHRARSRLLRFKSTEREPEIAHEPALPSATTRPSTSPLTPLPVTERTPRARPASRPVRVPRRRSPRRAGARWRARRAAASRAGRPRPIPRRQDRDHVAACLRSVCRSCPCTSVSTCSSRLERLGDRISTPAPAPFPVTHHDRHRRRQAERAGTGDDQHRDRGDQRMGERGGGPQSAQPRSDSSATAITAGTNQPATTSASRWIGARRALRLGHHGARCGRAASRRRRARRG